MEREDIRYEAPRQAAAAVAGCGAARGETLARATADRHYDQRNVLAPPPGTGSGVGLEHALDQITGRIAVYQDTVAELHRVLDQHGLLRLGPPRGEGTNQVTREPGTLSERFLERAVQIDNLNRLLLEITQRLDI